MVKKPQGNGKKKNTQDDTKSRNDKSNDQPIDKKKNSRDNAKSRNENSNAKPGAKKKNPGDNTKSRNENSNAKQGAKKKNSVDSMKSGNENSNVNPVDTKKNPGDDTKSSNDNSNVQAAGHKKKKGKSARRNRCTDFVLEEEPEDERYRKREVESNWQRYEEKDERNFNEEDEEEEEMEEYDTFAFIKQTAGRESSYFESKDENKFREKFGRNDQFDDDDDDSKYYLAEYRRYNNKGTFTNSIDHNSSDTSLTHLEDFSKEIGHNCSLDDMIADISIGTSSRKYNNDSDISDSNNSDIKFPRQKNSTTSDNNEDLDLDMLLEITTDRTADIGNRWIGGIKQTSTSTSANKCTKKDDDLDDFLDEMLQ